MDECRNNPINQNGVTVPQDNVRGHSRGNRQKLDRVTLSPNMNSLYSPKAQMSSQGGQGVLHKGGPNARNNRNLV